MYSMRYLERSAIDLSSPNRGWESTVFYGDAPTPPAGSTSKGQNVNLLRGGLKKIVPCKQLWAKGKWNGSRRTPNGDFGKTRDLERRWKDVGLSNASTDLVMQLPGVGKGDLAHSLYQNDGAKAGRLEEYICHIRRFGDTGVILAIPSILSLLVGSRAWRAPVCRWCQRRSS
jgi:hypothetical protein